MLWTRPLTMLQLLALLLASELVRTGFFVAALPLLGPGLGLGPAVIGAMVGAHYLADALGKGPMGLVSERWGLGRVLGLGALLGLLTVLGTRLWPSAWWGVLACALWGLVFGTLWPGLMSVSQALARPGRTARALAVSNLSVAPAILAGVLLVGPLIQGSSRSGWTLLLGAQGLAVLLALGLWRLRLPAPETARPGEPPVPGQAAPQPGWGREWGRVAVLLPAAFAQTLAPGLLVTLLYPLLAHLGLGLRDLAGPGLAAAAAFALSLGLLGRLADQVHPRRALTPGLLLLAAVFALVAVSGGPEVRSRLWVVAPLLGVGYGAFMAGWNGLVARTLPAQHRAAAWGTVMAVESLGYSAGPLLGGAAWQFGGQAGVFGLGAAVFLLTELYYLWPGRGLVRRAGGT
ncbi:MFS transporter [uncultured Deinococcus sp.]|uniref:MFS transporter n=1 Tax=uncultured Deinococcus sp. TaxID=158789 RepID=UPI0025857162|nr:MFS transporter [uncultured Deinococcus sp.]